MRLRCGATAACAGNESSGTPMSRGSAAPAAPMRKSDVSMSWGGGVSYGAVRQLVHKTRSARTTRRPRDNEKDRRWAFGLPFMERAREQGSGQGGGVEGGRLRVAG